MLSFKKIDFSDIPVLKAYFNSYPARQCDRAVGSTVMWRDYFNNRYAVIDGTIILSAKFKNEICFSFPIGRNVESALDAIDEYCDSLNIPTVFCSVNKNDLSVLMKKYPGSKADADRDWFDYLYQKDAIMNLIGKNEKSDIPELVAFTRNFTFNAEKDESANLELQMCIEVLENYDTYGMPGGVLRVDGNVVGYSIGEIIGDTLFCHIEKADISYHGAYQMLTNQFLRMYASSDEVKFVNREEDCGDEGLRKSKLSYNPVELIEKNTVFIAKG